MAMLNGVKCARCRIPVEGSDDTFSCPRCGVRDSCSGIGREIAEQLHEKRRRSLQDKVRNVLDGMKANRVTTRSITGQPYRFIYEADYVESANVRLSDLRDDCSESDTDRIIDQLK